MNSLVEPGKRLGNYFIGEKFATLQSKIPNDASVSELVDTWRYEFKPYAIWVNKKTLTVSQVGAGEGFEGDFFGIGIGSTLEDVTKHIGTYKEELDVYVLPRYPGIAFELREEDFDEDLEEETTPFGHIIVFDPEEVFD